jgi:glutathione S-transferase
VIAAYLDEAFPGHPLLPASPADRARARWLEEYADTRLGDLCIWSLFYQRIVGPMVFGEPTDEARVERTLSEGLPNALDYLEGEAPADGFRFGGIGLADISVASFFRNAAYARFEIDASRWPRSAAWVARTLAHDCLDRFLKFEQAQLSTNPQGRRQALLAAGAPLAEESYGVRQPTRGVMTL